MEYRARFSREGRHWLISFPDCPGCQTFGRSREQALEHGKEALEGWLEAHFVGREVPPRPSATRGTPVHISAKLSVALQLRWWRGGRGVTQAEAAKLVGVSQQQIAKLEHPDGNPTLAALEKVAEALGLRLDVTLTAA